MLPVILSVKKSKTFSWKPVCRWRIA